MIFPKSKRRHKENFKKYRYYTVTHELGDKSDVKGNKETPGNTGKLLCFMPSFIMLNLKKVLWVVREIYYLFRTKNMIHCRQKKREKAISGDPSSD